MALVSKRRLAPGLQAGYGVGMALAEPDHRKTTAPWASDHVWAISSAKKTGIIALIVRFAPSLVFIPS